MRTFDVKNLVCLAQLPPSSTCGLRRHRSPKHPRATPARSCSAIPLLRWSPRRQIGKCACGSERPAGDRSPKPLWCRRRRHRRVCRRHEFHPRQWAPGRCDGAAAAASSWGSGTGLVGGARPPRTAEITFHAAIRAAENWNPRKKLRRRRLPALPNTQRDETRTKNVAL